MNREVANLSGREKKENKEALEAFHAWQEDNPGQHSQYKCFRAGAEWAGKRRAEKTRSLVRE
jgi:hypothetical protein